MGWEVHVVLFTSMTRVSVSNRHAWGAVVLASAGMIPIASCGSEDSSGGQAESVTTTANPSTLAVTSPVVPTTTIEVAVPATSAAETTRAAVASTISSTVAAATTAAPVDCSTLGTTTVATSATTTTTMPTLCDLVDQVPPDQIAGVDPAEAQIWEGTVSGVIEPVGCTPVTITGWVSLLVLPEGDLFGLGVTTAGEYTCDNGAAIPVMDNGYAIEGEMTDVFTLVFSDGVTVTSSPIADGHAVVTQDTGFGVVTIDLVCATC